MPQKLLTVINKTPWDTRDLRRVLLACEKWLDLRWARTVTITNTRTRAMTGYADYPSAAGSLRTEGTYATLRIHRPKAGEAVMSPEDFTEFTWLVEHELAHNKGLAHSQMDKGSPLKTCNHHSTPAWADRLKGLRVRVAQKAPKKVTTSDERVRTRAAKVDADLVRWERKLKLAKTKVKKLQEKQRYYAKRLATEPAEEG